MRLAQRIDIKKVIFVGSIIMVTEFVVVRVDDSNTCVAYFSVELRIKLNNLSYKKHLSLTKV